jgi:hypothetical protein
MAWTSLHPRPPKDRTFSYGILVSSASARTGKLPSRYGSYGRCAQSLGGGNAQQHVTQTAAREYTESDARAQKRTHTRTRMHRGICDRSPNQENKSGKNRARSVTPGAGTALHEGERIQEPRARARDAAPATLSTECCTSGVQHPAVPGGGKAGEGTDGASQAACREKEVIKVQKRRRGVHAQLLLPCNRLRKRTANSHTILQDRADDRMDDAQLCGNTHAWGTHQHTPASVK